MPNLNNYGKALFDIAIEKNAVQELFDDFDSFSKIINENNEWLHYITICDKDQAVENIDKLKFSNKIFNNFIKVLYENKVLKFFNEIKKSYFSLCDNYLKITFVLVKTAKKLSTEKKEYISKKINSFLNKNKVVINYKIDDTLLSGYKIEYNGLELDKSVSTRLEKLFFNL